MAKSMKGTESNETAQARSRFAFGQVDRETNSKSCMGVAESASASLPYSAAAEAHGGVAPPSDPECTGNLKEYIDRRTTGGIKTTALSIADQFVKQGWINFRGQRIRTPDDFANIAAIYRSPQFETLRIFLTRGDDVVSHWGVTSRTLNRVTVYDEAGKFIPEVLDRMKRTGADGYWLSHNHPSGDSTPSGKDILITKRIAGEIPGLHGHVVTNGTNYHLIKPHGNVEKFVYRGSYKNTSHLEGTVASLVNNMVIGGTNDLCLITRLLRDDEDQISLIFLSSKLGVRAVQEVPRKFFEKTDEMVGYVKNRMLEFGAYKICSYSTYSGNNDAIMRTVEKLWDEEYLTDHKSSESSDTAFDELEKLPEVMDCSTKESRQFKKPFKPTQVKETTPNIHHRKRNPKVVDEYDMGI